MTGAVHLALMAAVAAAVSVGLRWIPFLLFARKRGDFSPRFRAFTRWISPVIIAALVVYSFGGLEWRGFAPYVAGVLTVLLHLLWRNPVVSIAIGTAAYMFLI